MSTRGIPGEARVQASSTLAVPMSLLTLVGLGVAGYMAYTDLTSSTLMCGGIGDCDTVHASAYAFLLGVPVSVLGLGSYAGIALLLVARQRFVGEGEYLALLGVLTIGVSGTVFSAYLTYVEFFVIHAVCPWCVASATVIAVLAFLAVVNVRQEIRRETGDRQRKDG